ncbi:MAG: hypothetical protein IIC92_01475 [Chloroflexi bacterium]|nr:hypothetical protein [Chloroflexota bacterium]
MVSRARDGQRVAQVTGGDPGIYGMAAPVYRALLELDERAAASVNLEAVPGVTAATASATLVVTPPGQTRRPPSRPSAKWCSCRFI